MLAYRNRFGLRRMLGWALLTVLALLVPAAGAIADKNADCLACHSDKTLTKPSSGGKVSLYVSEAVLMRTLHGQLGCTDCHLGLDPSKTPHAANIRPVMCVNCHNDARSRHTSHKRLVPAGGSPSQVSASCKSCHGSHMSKPLSTACGRCHKAILKEYEESIHGRAVARGVKSAPVCTDCHGEHLISAPSSPDSPVYPTRVVATCSKCHASERIEEEYGIPKQRFETYRESYHGVANRFGDVTVANCASCHGSHDIRPSSDPKSSINKKNLPRTCGKCHAGANKSFAKGKIHVVISRSGQPQLYYVSNGFKWLTISTMMALVGHIGLDLFAKYRRRRSER